MAKRKRTSSKFLERRRKKAKLDSTSVLFTPSSPSKAPAPPPTPADRPDNSDASDPKADPDPAPPKKCSRVGNHYQVDALPSPSSGTGISGPPSSSAPPPASSSVTWDPAEYQAVWGSNTGPDPIQKYLSTIPAKYQDIAMGCFHCEHYDLSKGKALAAARIQAAGGEAPPSSQAPDGDKDEGSMVVGSDSDSDDHQTTTAISRRNALWSATSRETFHRLIILHKKNLRLVARDMPDKNMGDVLQYYLSVYKVRERCS